MREVGVEEGFLFLVIVYVMVDYGNVKYDRKLNKEMSPQFHI